VNLKNSGMRQGDRCRLGEHDGHRSHGPLRAGRGQCLPGHTALLERLPVRQIKSRGQPEPARGYLFECFAASGDPLNRWQRHSCPFFAPSVSGNQGVIGHSHGEKGQKPCPGGYTTTPAAATPSPRRFGAQGTRRRLVGAGGLEPPTSRPPVWRLAVISVYGVRPYELDRMVY